MPGDLGGLGEMLGEGNPMDALLGGAMPGADEAAAMQLLLEYLDDPDSSGSSSTRHRRATRFDCFQLPELMDTMTGRLLQFRQRIGGMFENVKGMFGGEEIPDEEGLEDLEVLRERIERLRAALRDPKRTDFRIVMIPEEMSVLESKRLRTRLDEFDIPVGTIVVNRVMEPLSDVTDDVEGSSSSRTSRTVRSASVGGTSSNQHLGGTGTVPGTDVKRVPLFADEVRGEGCSRSSPPVSGNRNIVSKGFSRP